LFFSDHCRIMIASCPFWDFVSSPIFFFSQLNLFSWRLECTKRRHIRHANMIRPALPCVEVLKKVIGTLLFYFLFRSGLGLTYSAVFCGFLHGVVTDWLVRGWGRSGVTVVVFSRAWRFGWFEVSIYRAYTCCRLRESALGRFHDRWFAW